MDEAASHADGRGLVLDAVPEPGRNVEDVGGADHGLHTVDALEAGKLLHVGKVDRRISVIVVQLLGAGVQYGEILAWDQGPAFDATDIHEEEWRHGIVEWRIGAASADEHLILRSQVVRHGLEERSIEILA